MVPRLGKIKNYVWSFKLELSLTLVYFFLYLPIVLHIHFYQNDDWYYYKQVELFLQGHFKLLNDIGMTFYLQGFIGALFSLIFGVKNIPLLTLFFSAASFFIFLIILRVNNTPKILGLLSSIIFISQPVFSYSILGFMGENYQLLFVLLSLLFINLFLLSPTRKVFLMVSLFFVFLSFLVKQNTLVLYLSFGLVLIFIREYKSSLLAFFSFLLNVFFYQYIFPKTQYMMGASNNISLSILVPQNLLFLLTPDCHTC